MAGARREGRARGLAAHFTFGSYCAQVVELSVDERKRIVVHKVTAVADVGQPVNLSASRRRRGRRSSMGSARRSLATCRSSADARRRNFDTYRLIRNREAPAAIEVTFSRARPPHWLWRDRAFRQLRRRLPMRSRRPTGERIRRMPFAKLGYDLARDPDLNVAVPRNARRAKPVRNESGGSRPDPTLRVCGYDSSSHICR